MSDPPRRPENLTCVAIQNKSTISPAISCEWDLVGRQTSSVVTTYTLNVAGITGQNHTVQSTENKATVTLDVFPFHTTLEIWVEAQNKLGKTESEHLKEEAGVFVKTKPPPDVKFILEESFPTSLLINWTHPIAHTYVRLIYEIRFCPVGAQSWSYVPTGDTAKSIESFRLQNLQPDTVYVTQVRCKNARGGQYWSDWSANATKRTPDDRPTSKPDLWKIIAEGDSVNERRVQFICKDPVFSNGKIKRFDMRIQGQKDNVNNRSQEWESFPVSMSEADSSQQKITFLKEINLPHNKSVKVSVTAINSVGKSPEASLGISEKANEFALVEELKVWPQGGRLWLEWKTFKSKTVSEYVVEWVGADQTDWQRENRSTRHTFIKGHLDKFVCYRVSVYPLYSGWIGKPTSTKAFLEQAAPSEGPFLNVNGKPGCTEAELVWSEIPELSRRGFITNYTLFYTNGTKVHNITVPGNITSYTLTSLSRNTKYDTWVVASTIRGSARGFNHSFTTQKYAPGEIEGTVVGISLGFLFLVLMMMLLCIYKEDVIKENFWPRIPNPGESTIGNWSPDYPLKTETPKESCLSGITVLDVDACDGKCVLEEDKASLPLKTDKYLSEEHSSGIGGSSCMSSPRQSVSDSDEGGDIADTTASTVQYSSVVTSNGYKGQTPSSQPQQALFSRSESTQPLLDSEENLDVPLQEGSRQSQRFPQLNAQKEEDSQPEVEQQERLETLDFGPLEEDSELTTLTDSQAAEWPPAAPMSNYMPQLGGYRAQ
uniref:Fibronectin type-III domain-containing protein n=1 Tax=Mola mola TaxID=94237 RepID=A0A3Q3VWU5_MOLML